MLLTGATQIEETATQLPQLALLHSVTRVQVWLIREFSEIAIALRLPVFLMCLRPFAINELNCIIIDHNRERS
jgi:hypothetical protein